MKFTKTEWEIIEHRLEVPDALADVFEDEGTHHRDEVYKACETLLATDGEFELEDLSEVERDVLIDACEGSVFMPLAKQAYLYDEINKGKWLAYQKACKSIEKKLGVNITRT